MVRVTDLDGSIVIEPDGPSSIVNVVVVSAAEWDQVVEIGWSTVPPIPDVVDLASREHDIAAWPGAGRVHGLEGSSLGPVGGRPRRAEREDLSLGSDDGEVAERSAEESTGTGDRYVVAVTGAAGRVDVFARVECLGIDDDDDLGSWSRCSCRSTGKAVCGVGQHSGQCVGPDVLPIGPTCFVDPTEIGRIVRVVHGPGGGLETAEHLRPEHRVEAGVEMKHAGLCIDAGADRGVVLLSLKT